MGKRSNFPKIKRDAYMTIDQRAIYPLVRYYKNKTISYYEPCAGDGSLINLFPSNFQCVGKSDFELDARITQYNTNAQYFITNPPWTRDILHSIIDNLRKQLPTWLLLDSDWMFTIQSSPYMKFCKVILPIGRLKWIPDSVYTGKDNCAWYLFVKKETQCIFIPRYVEV